MSEVFIDFAASFSVQFESEDGAMRGISRAVFIKVICVIFGLGSFASLKAQSQQDLMDQLQKFKGRAFRVTSQDTRGLPGDTLRIEGFYLDRSGHPNLEATWLKRGNISKTESFRIFLSPSTGELALSKESPGVLFSSKWQTGLFRVTAQEIRFELSRAFLAWPFRLQHLTLSCAQALQRGSEAGRWLD
jgi:hypothetical protein